MDRLRAIATATGSFTRQDAFGTGCDDKSIRRALKARLWHRIRAGVYTFPDLWPDHPDERHRITGRAVARRFGDSVALSHTTAALAHGLDVWGADLGDVHVTRLDGGAGRTEAGVVHHEGMTLPADLVDLAGHRVMGAIRAAVETASLVSTEAGVVVLDSLLRKTDAVPEELLAAHTLMESWPGMRRTGLAVRLADGRSESVGESRGRYLFYTQGLPAPELQYVVCDDTGRLLGTTDYAWPDHRLFGEFDGAIKYNRLLLPGEAPGDAVFREKRREDRLCEQLGWRMVRIVWADLYSPAATAARVRRLLLAAA
ncbi:MAG: hypothetical protein ABIQ59_16675 [Nocardioidaceae bacterium]